MADLATLVVVKLADTCCVSGDHLNPCGSGHRHAHRKRTGRALIMFTRHAHLADAYYASDGPTTNKSGAAYKYRKLRRRRSSAESGPGEICWQVVKLDQHSIYASR